MLESKGMKAVANDEPAPVFACWNGIIATRAEPFLLPQHRRHLSNTTKAEYRMPATHPAFLAHVNTTPAKMPPLRFRSSVEGECFSSESFLLPYDLRRQFNMQKIFMNTRVINSYEWRFYFWFKWVTRHWLVKWWIESIEGVNEAATEKARLILGHQENVWKWDGGECQPVSVFITMSN